MIAFNELSINSEGSELIIDISVLEEIYYDNIYIDKIIIDTQDTYIESGPSNNPIYEQIIEGNEKSKEIILNSEDLGKDLKSNLFFIYVKAKGIPSSDTPCGRDNIYNVGAILYPKPIYCSLLNYIKYDKSKCDIPQHFINQYILYKALQLSLYCHNYKSSVYYYNKFFKNKHNIYTNNCNCNG